MEVLEKYEKIANEMLVKHNLTDWKFVIDTNAKCKYMASRRTQTMNKEINFNNQQIVFKKPNTAICYIHC